jgi:hypothetical protein
MRISIIFLLLFGFASNGFGAACPVECSSGTYLCTANACEPQCVTGTSCVFVGGHRNKCTLTLVTGDYQSGECKVPACY